MFYIIALDEEALLIMIRKVIQECDDTNWRVTHIVFNRLVCQGRERSFDAVQCKCKSIIKDSLDRNRNDEVNNLPGADMLRACIQNMTLAWHNALNEKNSKTTVVLHACSPTNTGANNKYTHLCYVKLEYPSCTLMNLMDYSVESIEGTVLFRQRIYIQVTSPAGLTPQFPPLCPAPIGENPFFSHTSTLNSPLLEFSDTIPGGALPNIHLDPATQGNFDPMMNLDTYDWSASGFFPYTV